MIGTRKWISEAENALSSTERGISSENINNIYFKKLLSQGRKISQLISYIWLSDDSQTAQKLDKYFKKDDEEKSLKKLLFANNAQTDEYQLLLKVFKKEKDLPIFGEEDEPFVEFRVVTDRFEGNISDPGPSDNGILLITIPYPPCPAIFDDITQGTGMPEKFAPIKKSELKEWLNQDLDQEGNYFYKHNPYIPATSS